MSVTFKTARNTWTTPARAACALTALREARAKIEDPSSWTQNRYARDIVGDAVPAKCPDAVRWCAYGAMDAVAGGSQADCETYLICAARAEFGGESPGHVNDTLGHEATLRMYDRAVLMAEADAQAAP